MGHKNRTGHNARHWNSTRQQRIDAANRMPQAPSTCDRLLGYLQSPEDWARDFLWAVFNDWYWRGCPEEPMPEVMRDCLFQRSTHGVKFAVDAPQTNKTTPISSDIDGAWVFARVAQIKDIRGRESTESEERWHAARKASEARRGDVVPGRYQRPIVTSAA